MTALNLEGPTPLYMQLAEELRSQITDGHLKPGAALPSEPDLMKTYDVSRTTVRQALNLLAEDNIIIKVQGRGTFVQQPEIKQELVSLRTLNEVVTSAGLVPEVRVIDVDMQAAITPYIKQQLQVAPDETVVRIERQHLVEGRPIAYAIIHLSGKFDWRFSVNDLKQRSIYSWLEQEANILVDRGRQVIKATAASDEAARWLGLALGAPVLYVENTSTTTDGTPIDFTEFYFPPDSYSLVVSLRRTQHGVSLADVQLDLTTSSGQSE